MADGSNASARCEHPRGSFENPLSRAQIESQVPHLCRSRLTPARSEEVIAAVNRLEDWLGAS